MSARPNVFSIAPGCAFLNELVSALCNGRIFTDFDPLNNPLLLPETTIYVPSRRAARALSVAFVDATSGKSQLLPTIRTLGDVHEDEFGVVSTLDADANLPKAVDSLERQLILSTLVQKWVDALSSESRRLYGDEEIYIPSSHADAVHLSADLCRLLDEIIQEESGWDRIAKIVPKEHAQWWSLTSNFLRIIMENWPNFLAEHGLTDPARRSLDLLNLRTAYYSQQGSKGPVIVAGSTGSVPSTRRFLEAVSQMPNGAIILPGLDMIMEDREWNSLTPGSGAPLGNTESHAQYGLASLLETLGVDRGGVKCLDQVTSTIESRSQIVSISLSLPEFSDKWKNKVLRLSDDGLTSAINGLTLIEASNERREALAIAAVLRETLDTPNKSAALVTPDRNLAQRVSIELRRFGIEADDSSGSPFRNTQFGLFLRQLIQVAFGLGTKIDIAALLKSPLMPVSLSADEARQTGEKIELQFLRGATSMPQPGALSNWMNTQISRSSRHNDDSGSAEEISRLIAHCERIDNALRGVVSLSEYHAPVTLGDYVKSLLEALTELCRNDQSDFVCALESGFAEAQELFESILTSRSKEHEIAPDDFPSVFDAIIASITVRQQTATHPRLHIYGPLEVRLLDYDRIVIGGLNEDSWPGATRNDAFLNRLMRQELGMASPERRTGLAAHDFQMLMGKKEVVLSRSSRVDKAPTIASRWLQRLLAVIGVDRAGEMRARGNQYLRIIERLDHDGQRSERISRPCPTPPLSARPDSLPVTDIEMWVRDPYALYAKRILNLRPLMPLEREADALLRGTLYHRIAEEYVSETGSTALPEERLLKLRNLAYQHITSEQLPREIEALWLMKFDGIARQFVEWETTHNATHPVTKILKEVSGGMRIAKSDFYLHARADRIDLLGDGRLLIIDYKTGSTPSLKQARTLSPQLALEGAIAAEGGFSNAKSSELADLAFLRLRPGNEFKYEKLSGKDISLREIVDSAKRNLEALIDGFSDPDKGYVSRRAPFRQEAMDSDYDHLARTREWSFGEDLDNG